jgi:lysozyme
VAGAGIRFAYLKATEGTGFTDPRFAAHRTAAERAGVAVAGYHYFQLCSDGAAQAEHFLSVLGDRQDPDLPPAVDLELAGSCATPPPATELLAEIREFLAAVDERLGTTSLVYLYPEFEERFGFADDLADHPQWVRRLGDRPPGRDWAVWQYDDRGSVPGVAGGVDRNRGTIPLGRS